MSTIDRRRVGLFFDDPLFEEFATWLTLGLAPYGSASLGEVQATCALIEDGDDDSWFGAWRDLADRLVEIDLSGCQMGDAELRQLMDDGDGVHYLEVLRLADTQVGDRGAMSLVQATNLRVLDIRGTNISRKMRRQLATLPHMIHVEGMASWTDWWRRLWKG